MFTNEELKRYQELLRICKDKGIAATNETEPVCIPLNRRKQKRVINNFLAAKDNLLGEFHKHESF